MKIKLIILPPKGEALFTYTSEMSHSQIKLLISTLESYLRTGINDMSSFLTPEVRNFLYRVSYFQLKEIYGVTLLPPSDVKKILIQMIVDGYLERVGTTYRVKGRILKFLSEKFPEDKNKL